MAATFTIEVDPAFVSGIFIGQGNAVNINFIV